jgi:rhodanese-related sulfurtransferase
MKIIMSMFLFFVVGVIPALAAQTQEISVIAKKFEFLPGKITVNRGVPVKIYLTSVDVDHGFAVSEFKIDKTVKKGEVAIVKFNPDKAGEFNMYCSVYCGMGHGRMKGKLIVQGYKDITVQELKEALKKKDFFLIDVHIPEQEHIPGTDAFIPYNEIEKYQDKLPKDKDTKIIVYCEAGPMGDTASNALFKLGYKDVYNLVGGKRSWDKMK